MRYPTGGTKAVKEPRVMEEEEGNGKRSYIRGEEKRRVTPRRRQKERSEDEGQHIQPKWCAAHKHRHTHTHTEARQPNQGLFFIFWAS